MVDVSAIAPSLALAADGIWRAAAHETVSYPAEGHQACFQVEDTSFWFNHRNACIAAAVKGFPPPHREPIFDIGGGNGFVSLGLAKAGFETVLVEPGEPGAANAKRRGVETVICATTSTAGFRASTLGAIGLFDVIEHIEDDLAFLHSMRNLLKPGGRLYVTVPAYPLLWSGEDPAAGHFRRYTGQSIGAVVQRAGFTLEYLTHIFRPLPLPILLFRALPYRLGLGRASGGAPGLAKDHSPGNGKAAGLVDWLLRSEVRNIDAKRAMSFGGSCLLVASAA
jgi:SAM-dependent methyltransferase